MDSGGLGCLMIGCARATDYAWRLPLDVFRLPDDGLRATHHPPCTKAA